MRKKGLVKWTGRCSASIKDKEKRSFIRRGREPPDKGNKRYS